MTTMFTAFDEQQPPGPQPAGFWIRAFARMIDWVVGWIAAAFGAGLVGALLALALLQIRHSIDELPALLEQNKWFEYVIGICGMLAYHTVAEGLVGQTLGKRLLGLQVISESLGQPALMQGFKRSLAFLYDSFLFGAIAAGNMGSSRMKQRAGDNWAGTYVVKNNTLPESQRPRLGLFLAVLIAAFAASLVVHVVLFGLGIAVRTLA